MEVNERYITDSDSENKILLEPYEYIRTIPGKQIRPKLIKAFNFWLNIPDDKLNVIGDLIEMLHNASLLIDDIEDNSKLRRGVPVAHNIYGVPLTINAANYIYFLAMEKALTLEHSDVTQIFVEQMLDLHHGQGMEIWWRDNFVSPSEDEYRQMVIKKCGGLFNLGVRLMQLFSTNDIYHKYKFNKLCQLLSLLFQIRDDYCNLISKEYTNNKSYCEDLTEGKFSFPILHAVNTHDTDTRIIHILKQHTQDIDLKRYCVQLLYEFGSIEYTKQTCEDLAKQVYDEIHILGGNTYLEHIIKSLMEIFHNDHDNQHEQDLENNQIYVINQHDGKNQQHLRNRKKTIPT
ncbi:unnamed protein product [Rotaria sp. Silwood1]|nr:unnamed protein product [Rotaria sp. Silwood1]CAF1581237.1 unnamed protein product [Rotaria sp. Silwood1]CAF3741533.1 unnamed protein product [Rotaria sp. Silwood1]CAF3799687.1 unnamed protein product [Rotaria sp. Silwood1]CAF4950309.1 unnamed protein product [Rotaria sp. Silwood1]